MLSIVISQPVAAAKDRDSRTFGQHDQGDPTNKFVPALFADLAIAMIPATLMFGLSAVMAETPPATPPGATAPAAEAPPATPTPPGTTTPATPVPPPAEVQTPKNPTAEAPKPPVTAPVQTADPFGEEHTLAPKTVLTLRNNATWENAFETLMIRSSRWPPFSTSRASSLPAT